MANYSAKGINCPRILFLNLPNVRMELSRLTVLSPHILLGRGEAVLHEPEPSKKISVDDKGDEPDHPPTTR